MSHPAVPAHGRNSDLPAVVDGEVTRVIEIHPYPNALTPLGGCTNFRGVIAYPPAWRQVPAQPCEG